MPSYFVWIKAWMENLSDVEKQTLIELLTKLRSGLCAIQKSKFNSLMEHSSMAPPSGARSNPRRRRIYCIL